MSIEQRQVQPDLWVVHDDLEVAVGYPKPVDQKILGGIALHGRITPQRLDEVAVRLDKAFIALREDETNEYGECIAYANNLTPEDQDLVEGTLTDTAMKQNHGMLRKESQSAHTLWKGGYGNKIFRLRKNPEAIILLEDGSTLNSTLYSLVGGDLLLEKKERLSDKYLSNQRDLANLIIAGFRELYRK